MADVDIGSLEGAALKAKSAEARVAANPEEFDILLLSSIDEALFTLGESARQATYFHIERTFKVSREEIPENLEDFQTALEKIFGIGARYIEILIMKYLYSKIGCSFQLKSSEQLEFVNYVEEAKDTINAGRRSEN
jgi:hypothetical protein